MDIEVKFANAAQREFYYATARNQTFSGGFNNGKTYSGCLKALTLLTSFPNYRMAIARQVRADLMRTTYQTFFKLCPAELIESDNKQEGFTTFKNRSMIYWMHLDKVDEGSLRGLEVNSILVDQAEECQEKVYDVLDARIGRWDGAEIPNNLLSAHGNWPKNNRTGKAIAPSYLMLLCNPDTQYHFIYRKYHPASLEKREKYFFVEGEWDASLGSSESYSSAMEKGGEYVEKYVRGQWGISNAQIHRLHPSSLLDYTPELLDKIKKKANLFRVLDHGDASPTCCLWFAAVDGVYIAYREYYVPNQIISYHRKSINELSENESYSANYADPSIFNKASQKNGGFWSVANEYLEALIGNSKPLAWVPADNNEFATRNRINELLGKQQKSFLCPDGGPALFFIRRSTEYSNGCFYAINELQSQRRKLLGYVDGSAQYCDDREESVADHAYDPTRYFVAMHGSARNEPKRPNKPNTLNYFKMMKQRKENVLMAASA
jgi:hypothetical protein